MAHKAAIRERVAGRGRPDPNVNGAAGTRQSAANPTTALAAFLAYAVLLPVTAGIGSLGTGAGLVLFVLAVYTGFRIAFELYRGASRWFVLTFHVFSFVFLGIAPLVQLGSGHLYWAVATDAGILFQASVVCLMGVLLFDVGLWLGSGSSRARLPRGGVRPSPRPILGRRSSDRAIILLCIASSVSLFVFVVLGGLPLVLASRSQMEAVLCPAQDVVGDLAACGVVSAVVRVPSALLTIAVLGVADVRSRSLLRVGLVLGLLGLALTSNPVSTPRFWLGAVGIGILGATVARYQLARLTMWLLLPATFIVIFPTLDFGRREGWSPDLRFASTAITDKQDFDAFQQVVNGVTYTEVFGLRNGAQSLTTTLFFVPRSIWTEKGRATGKLVTQSLGVTDNTNVSAPLWEEGFVDFGLAGAASMLLALGVLVARVEAWAKDWWRRRIMPLAFVPMFAGYGVFLLRGSLLPVAGGLAATILLASMATRIRGPGAPPVSMEQRQ